MPPPLQPLCLVHPPPTPYLPATTNICYHPRYAAATAAATVRATAVLLLPRACLEKVHTSNAKSPRMVPGALASGLVSPSILRPIDTASLPSQAMHTTGPEIM